MSFRLRPCISRRSRVANRPHTKRRPSRHRALTRRFVPSCRCGELPSTHRSEVVCHADLDGASWDGVSRCGARFGRRRRRLAGASVGDLDACGAGGRLGRAAILVRPPVGHPHPAAQPQRQPRTPKVRRVYLERLCRIRPRLSPGWFGARELAVLDRDVGGINPVARLPLRGRVLDDFGYPVGCTENLVGFNTPKSGPVGAVSLAKRCEPRRLPGVFIGSNRDRPRGYAERR
jgi:hypothetical protein